MYLSSQKWHPQSSEQWIVMLIKLFTAILRWNEPNGTMHVTKHVEHIVNDFLFLLMITFNWALSLFLCFENYSVVKPILSNSFYIQSDNFCPKNKGNNSILSTHRYHISNTTRGNEEFHFDYIINIIFNTFTKSIEWKKRKLYFQWKMSCLLLSFFIFLYTKLSSQSSAYKRKILCGMRQFESLTIIFQIKKTTWTHANCNHMSGASKWKQLLNIKKMLAVCIQLLIYMRQKHVMIVSKAKSKELSFQNIPVFLFILFWFLLLLLMHLCASHPNQQLIWARGSNVIYWWRM